MKDRPMADQGRRSDRPGLTRRAALQTLGAAGFATLASCAGPSSGPTGGTAGSPSAGGTTPTTSASATASPTPSPAPLTGEQMAARATVPVLCYHQVRDWTADDSGYARDVLVCPPANFREHLDALVDDGWTTITPDAYLAHLRGEESLPTKPVLLSFDDGKDNQADTAFIELSERGLTATLYVMTVVIGKKGWISRDEIADIAAAGHVLGSHTYDHQRTPDLTTAEERDEQYVRSRATLQDLSGQPVETFAYPYGLWAPAVVPHLVDAGYTSAFQLTDKPCDPATPAHTLRRQLVASRWSGERLLARLASFS